MALPCAAFARAVGTLLLAAFVVTGALMSGETYRRSPRQAGNVPFEPNAPSAPAARPASARTRASDRLPPAPTLPAPGPEPAPATASFAPPPASPTLDGIAAALPQWGEAGRRVTVIGSARDVGTTLTSIALARTLSHSARVILVDLAFASPNIDVISDDPTAPGMADLVRGTASFNDIITRDRVSRTHIVTAGQVGGDAAGLLESQMLWAAVGALAQSYDYMVIDAGAQSQTALAPFAAAAPFAVLVGGETPRNALAALAGELQSAGFAEVAVLTGPPPALEEAAAQSAA